MKIRGAKAHTFARTRARRGAETYSTEAQGFCFQSGNGAGAQRTRVSQIRACPRAQRHKRLTTNRLAAPAATINTRQHWAVPCAAQLFQALDPCKSSAAVERGTAPALERLAGMCTEVRHRALFPGLFQPSTNIFTHELAFPTWESIPLYWRRHRGKGG